MPPKGDRQPQEIDLLIGRQVRAFRKAAGLTMKDLAASLRITHQQVQKYETGANRIPAASLNKIAKLLDTTESILCGETSNLGFAEQKQQPFGSVGNDEQRLLKAFRAITSPAAQKALLDLADQMAAPNIKEK